MDKKTLTIKEIALFGMLGGLTFGAKFVMSGLPNIEPVSLLLMLFAVTFGVKALFPMGIYIVLEILIYGIPTGLQMSIITISDMTLQAMRSCEDFVAEQL